MRFVAVKSETAQASAVVFRARDILVRQRTQIINALRGHLAEYGFVCAQGPSHIARIIEHVANSGNGLPDAARTVLGIMIDTLQILEKKVKILDVEIARRAREDEDARRLMTVPGVGATTS
jgi:transposase